MKRRKLAVPLILALALMAQPASASFIDSGLVYLDPEEGSWVGDGIGATEITWEHGVDGVFALSVNFDLGARVSVTNGSFWSFDFAAPTYNADTNSESGNLLEVGFYEHATRFPFNSPTAPGLNFSGNGRGNNRLGGWFDVLEVVYSEDRNALISLAVDFRQYDENEDMTGPSTFGSLRINSDLALNTAGEPFSQVPLPLSMWYIGSGFACLFTARKNKRR